MNFFHTQLKHPLNYHFDFNAIDKIAFNQRQFQTNFVKTSKYNIITFIPIALVKQFRRLPNVYFLIIAILQTIPQISTLTPITAWAPLAVVVGISLIRQAIEDYHRYQSDKHTNSQRAYVRRNNKFEEVTWSDIVVGDICCVHKNQTFPADLVLLFSSGQGGIAYIETASLDGQKNLKPKLALRQSSQQCNSDQKLEKLKGRMETDLPRAALNQFTGKLKINQKKQVTVTCSKQFLYRGAKLRNTQYIYGLVIYTGNATKTILNSGRTKEKMSQIENKVNSLLVFIFLFQCILAFICATAYGLTDNSMRYAWYIEHDRFVPGSSILIFLSYLVLFNTMIPISLIVSLQIVKYIQGILIQSDNLLFNKQKGLGIKVYCSSLNEQLGQIQYIFTDKTGTLTVNKMNFVIAIIGLKIYGQVKNQPQYSHKKKILDPVQEYHNQQLQRILKGIEKIPLQIPYQIQSSQKNNHIIFYDYKSLSSQYFLALSLAHECIVQQINGKITYQGVSPDQITLVKAAQRMGYQFIKSDNRYAYISIHGQVKQFELLQIFTFSSDRKRMSIVIKDNDKIKMFIKGADNIIRQRLKSKRFEDSLVSQLDYFSKSGLRTLLVAMKIISIQQYQKFKNNISSAKSLKQEEFQKDKLQRDFYLLGATVVEDNLQQNVPQTLKDLIRANIKIWMLSGDKRETARNIAKSTNLIQSNFITFELQLHQNQQNIDKYIQSLARINEKLKNIPQIKKALILEGNHLKILMRNQICKEILARLAGIFDTVICCRLAPQQKADLVYLVKKYLNKITLAIGDGANDVPMIKQAHIGIGLYGQQGMSAVQASDYALPQFQGLWRLILVHGRWNYIRIADMILYFFYKNMLFTIPQFYFAFQCAFSAQSFFDDAYISLFNIIFTSIPLIIRALLQQDVYYIYKANGQRKQKTLRKLPQEYEQKKALKKLFPKIYYIGKQNTIFNYKRFVLWIFQAIIQGLMIYLFCIYALGTISLNQSGINTDLWVCSITCFSGVILLVTFKLATHTKFWSWLMAFSLFFLSVCLYIAYMWISNIMSTNVKGTIIPIYTSIQTYLVVFFCTGILLIFDGLVIYLNYLYDYQNGKISKIRSAINDQRISDTSFYQQVELSISAVN